MHPEEALTWSLFLLVILNFTPNIYKKDLWCYCKLSI